MDGFVGEASGLWVASGEALAVVDVGSADGSEGYTMGYKARRSFLWLPRLDGLLGSWLIF